MSLSTGSGSPEGLAKALHTLLKRDDRRLCLLRHGVPQSSRVRVRRTIERPPQQPVRGDDEHRHDGDAERDPRVIARLGHLRDIGAEPEALSLVGPQLTASETMLAFQAPPEAVIAPVT